MIKKLKEEYHDINIVGYKCPPVKTYEKLSQKEFVDDMIQQNADIIWVSLGFPKQEEFIYMLKSKYNICLLYTSPSPRDSNLSRMPSSA